MGSKHIEALLNKYWQAETSLEEEQQLRNFFLAEEVPEHLTETAALFRYYETQKRESLNDVAFEQSVKASMAGKQTGRVVSIFYNSMRIAAGVAVLMVAIWFIRTEVRQTTPQAVVDTYDDPKLAFEETKKALLMISKSFGKAEAQARKINLINEAQKEIGKKDDSSL
jgi:hypothetical protein